jgi:putative hemolysin
MYMKKMKHPVTELNHSVQPHEKMQISILKKVAEYCNVGNAEHINCIEHGGTGARRTDGIRRTPSLRA